jgi:hypothetical protein
MTLPNKFKFLAYGLKYDATVIGDSVFITWIDTYDKSDREQVYPSTTVEGFVANKTWEILNEPNGVGSNGSPMFFDKTMLKPMMRFKTANGKVWIAVQGVQKPHQGDEFSAEDVVGVSDGGWMYFITTDSTGGGGYKAVEVYAAPEYNGKLLNTTCVGELIWKSAKAKTKEQERLECEIMLYEEKTLRRAKDLLADEDILSMKKSRLAELSQ